MCVQGQGRGEKILLPPAGLFLSLLSALRRPILALTGRPRSPLCCERLQVSLPAFTGRLRGGYAARPRVLKPQVLSPTVALLHGHKILSSIQHLKQESGARESFCPFNQKAKYLSQKSQIDLMPFSPETCQKATLASEGVWERDRVAVQLPCGKTERELEDGLSGAKPQGFRSPSSQLGSPLRSLLLQAFEYYFQSTFLLQKHRPVEFPPIKIKPSTSMCIFKYYFL